MGSGWRALRLAMGSMTAVGIVIILAAEPIAAFMIDDPEVIAYTVSFVYILGAVQPLMAIEFALGGALRGPGIRASLLRPPWLVCLACAACWR